MPATAATAVLALVVSVTALVVAVSDDDWGPGRMMSTSAGQYDDGPGRSGGQPGWMSGMPGMMGGMRGGMMGRGPGMMGGGPSAMWVDDEADWLVEMVAHHEEAIEMAGELERSARPEMRALGASIVEGQTAQVEQMQEWLSRWYSDRSEESDYEPMMRDLSDLEGDDLDRVFLEDMVGHHMVAVMMSQHLLLSGAAEHQQVADLASTIRDEQHAEIVTMQQWLRDWFW
jgi:uncharacterized protein (DUF305 family)